ncbi:MAG: ribose 5-phosphate isomerase B [Coriobacteriales bacterium]|jgi:ribose 5-phosphate isomerase B|nr:ribose 5-phosphate isomerase B [Coriobacteriales bacterium]
MRVALASDHGGFEQKQALVAALVREGYEVTDLGPFDDASVDYPDYAVLVARAVANGSADRGVLVCGTGIGMAIAANKIAGIRAATVCSPEFAALARAHNDANVLALSGRFVDFEANRKIAELFLETPFAEGRHARRVAKIEELDGGETRQTANGEE